MTSEASKAWREKHASEGCRIEPVAQLFIGGPMRWGAFKDAGPERGREVSAFVTVPGNPELDREVPV